MNPVEELLGTLNKVAKDDKCSAARKETNPLKCEFAKIGQVTYCKTHGVVKV